MKTKKIFFFITVVLFLCNTLIAQESFNLKYKFSEGDVYRYKISSKSDITQEVMGQEMKINVFADMIQKYETSKPENGNIILLMSLDSASVTTKMPMNDTTMNLTQFLGKRQKIVVSEKGKILSKTQVDTLIGSTDMLKQVTSGFEKLFILPEESIKIGDIWNQSQVDTLKMMGGNITNKSDIQYKLVGTEIKDGVNCLKIELDAKNTNEGTASIQGMALTIEGTGKSKGLLYFSIDKGMVIASEMQVDNDMTMAATGQQNMIIPITQSTKATQTLIK